MSSARSRQAAKQPQQATDTELGDAVLSVLAGEDREAVGARYGISVQVLDVAESTFMNAGQRALSNNVLPFEESRRQSILRVAARLFAEHGYRATKIEEVADEMGLTRPAVYYYFRNKDELFTAVIEEAVESFGDPFDYSVSPDEDFGTVLLDAMTESLAMIVGDKLDFFRVLLWEVQEHPRKEVADRVAETRSRALGNLSRLLSIGIDRGDVRVSSPDLAAAAIIGFINSAPRWYDSSRGRADAVIGVIIDLVTGGILAIDA